MKCKHWIIMLLVLVAISGGLLSQVAAQEKYPTRPIEIVTTFPPGGVSELTVRTWAKYMEKILGVPIVNLAKPGGGGVIGMQYVVSAKPDGYTTLNAGNLAPTLLSGTAPFKFEDLRIVAQVTQNGNIMAVAADAPWKTWQEFVDYAKKNPGVKYGHPGLGIVAFYRAENLNRQLGLKMVNLPSQGDAESVARLLGHHIPIANIATAIAKPQIEAGKLRALLSFEPAKEFGLPGSVPDLHQLYGKDFPDIPVGVYLYAPAKTPDHIVQTLEKTFEQMSKNPEFVADCLKMNTVSKFEGSKLATDRAKRTMEIMRAINADQPKK
ncbi:MAG TPA: tripartite tricarboxylate transporter substrate binding protein [Syntrophorhabdaceae bacterium]|nr:tripartite tricarboxylate transporter substrate binding protein [Syntrophorhabdaceae bacterium]